MACVENCMEKAIALNEEDNTPVIDSGKCLSCGKCISVCPTGTLAEERKGYRITLGGKLGRHPKLGMELPGVYGLDETLKCVDSCLDHYQRYCKNGERFGEILKRKGLDGIKKGNEMNESEEIQ